MDPLADTKTQTMLDIEAVITEKFPDLPKKKTGKLAIKLIKALTHEQEINEFIKGLS